MNLKSQGERHLFERSEQQAVDVLESMSDAFFSIDKDWRVTRVNAQHEKTTRLPREQQLGKNLLDLFFSMPEARQSKYWLSYHKAMAERVPVEFEDYYPPLDIYTAVRVYPTADGGLAVFFTDTTERRRANLESEAEKRKFESIFVDSPASMALLRGTDLVFENVNPKYKELMGGRELVGKPLHEALPELKGQAFHALMLQVFETGKTFNAREALARLIRRPGGEPEDTYFDFTYSRVEDGSGRPYGVYIHAVDTTEQVLARRQVEELAESLKKALQARDEFLSIASHELNTPITALKMQLQMTRRAVRPEEGVAPTPAKLAKTLDIATRQIERLSALIEDLLDVSRVESGKMTYRFEPVGLAGLVAEVAERFTDQVAAAKCSLCCPVVEDVAVTCDRFRIEQVLINLLTNAIKYGAGSRIDVCVRALSTGAEIAVTDGGLGIAPEKQAKVFDRFERAITHKSISGLGLGLYITRQIVGAHGGTIDLTSELGKGSTFTVTLPAHPA